MRTQWELLLGLFVINLGIGLVIGLALPGTGYVAGAASGMNATDYENHFNATSIVKSWSGTPFSGIPVIGDIFGGLSFLWQNIQYLVDGLPMLLDWIKTSFITDSTAQAAFTVIEYAIRAVYALLISMFVIEFISGRVPTD